MVKNIYDEWNKYDKAIQDSVKKKAQDAINNLYDQNKITSHIQNNFDTTFPSSSTNKTSISNSSNINGSINNTPSNTCSETNSNTLRGITTTTTTKPKYYTISVNTGNNYKPMEIPLVNTIPKPTTNTQTPTKQNNINNNLNNNTIKSNINNNIGISPKGEKYSMNSSQKAERDYYDILKKNPQARSVLNTQKNPGTISNVISPDHRGGTINTTYNEDINKPSDLTAYDEEYIKELSKYTNGKENNFPHFKEYWDKIKEEKEKVPDEIKDLTLEKFNSLSDEEKLKLYKPWNRYQEQLRKEKEKEQENQNNNTQFAKAEVRYKPLLASGNMTKNNPIETKTFTNTNLIINGTSFEENTSEFYNQMDFNSNSNPNCNFAKNLEENQRQSKDVVGEMKKEQETYRELYSGIEEIREKTKREQEEVGEEKNNEKWERIFNHRKKQYHEQNGFPNGNELKIYYNGTYNDGKKNWTDKPYTITGIPTTQEIYKEYEKFIEPSKEKEKEAMNNLNPVNWGFLILGKNASYDFINHFRYGNGEKLIYGPNNDYVKSIKENKQYNDWITGLKEEVSKKGNKDNINEILNGYTKNSGLRFEGKYSDLKNAIASTEVNLKGEFNDNGDLVLFVKFTDVYDFHYTDAGGNRWSKGMERNANEAGVYLQENGLAHPFEWEMYFTDKISF